MDGLERTRLLLSLWRSLGEWEESTHRLDTARPDQGCWQRVLREHGQCVTQLRAAYLTLRQSYVSEVAEAEEVRRGQTQA